MKNIASILFSFIAMHFLTPCSAQEYHKLIGDSVLNDIYGSFKLQQGGFISYGKLYDRSSSIIRPVICKTDDNGNIVWQKSVHGSPLYGINAGVELTSGEFMFFASYGNAPNTVPMTFKTDSGGNILWSKSYSIDVSQATLSYDGNILAGGTIGSSAIPYMQFVIKMDTAGTILWNTVFRRLNRNDYLLKIQEGPDRNIYTIGGINLIGPINDSAYCTLSKLDSAGNVLWSKHGSGPTYVMFRDIRILPSGNLLLSGTTELSPPLFQMTCLFEADTSGTLLWQKVFTLGNEGLMNLSMSIDSSQHVHLKGITRSNHNLFNLETDSSGIIYSSWKDPGQYASLTISASSTLPPGFFSCAQLIGNIFKWALIQADNTAGICNLQSLNAFKTIINPIGLTYGNLIITTLTYTIGNATLSTQSLFSNSQDSCTVTEHKAKKLISVFPNPTRDRIHFNIPTDIHSIMIIDMLGKVIFLDQYVYTEQYEFNCNKLSSGIYSITFTDEEDKRYYSRFLVHR